MPTFFLSPIVGLVAVQGVRQEKRNVVKHGRGMQ